MVIKRLDFTSFMKKICKNPKNPEKPLDSGGGGDIVKPASYDFEKTKQLHDESIKDLSLEGKCNIEGVECRPVFEVLKKHVKQYTPERASAITETAPDTIRRIAREYVDHARILNIDTSKAEKLSAEAGGDQGQDIQSRGAGWARYGFVPNVSHLR